MKKLSRLTACLAAAAVFLSGCGTGGSEYISVKDYSPSVQTVLEVDGKTVVKNFAALRQAIRDMSYAGKGEGHIAFDAAYDGDTTEDLASACWQLRTQDALCAYCVENIAYEINKIVTINEASIYITYSEFTEKPENIRHMSFSAETEDMIYEALLEGTRRLAVLVGTSSYSGDDMAAVAARVYRENPAIVPSEPEVSVNLFSGNNWQRLYEINISYGCSDEELAERRERLAEAAPFGGGELPEGEPDARCLAAANHLTENCALSDDATKNSAYSALVDGEGDSEGIALAFVELCHRLKLDCRIVYGQLDRREHCWNIVKIGTDYYHFDVSDAIESGTYDRIMKNDESFWGIYRWDIASYPKCAGTLQPDLPEREDAGTEAQE